MAHLFKKKGMIIQAVALAGVGALFALFPVRKSQIGVVCVLVLFAGLLPALYMKLGGHTLLQAHEQKVANALRAQQYMAGLKGPEELIERLKERVESEPENAEGWYLLGRLYASQGQWLEAKDAFLHALNRAPQSEKIIVNYVQSIWQLQNERLDDGNRHMLEAVLARNTKQPDALLLLAADAYRNHQFSKAVLFWRQLLEQLPPDSKEAQTIRQAIEEAEKRVG